MRKRDSAILVDPCLVKFKCRAAKSQFVQGVLLNFPEQPGVNPARTVPEYVFQAVAETKFSARRGRTPAANVKLQGSQIAMVTVEVWEEPTVHRVDVAKMLEWLKYRGRSPYDETRKEKLRTLIKS